MRKEFSAYDPVTSLLEKIIVSLQHEGFANGGLKDYDGHAIFNPIKQLSLFRDGYRSALHNRALEYVVSNFPKLEYAFEAAFLIFNRTVNSMNSDERKAEAKELQETYRKRFSQLQSGINALTPAHLALQVHFYSFVVESPTTWTQKDKLNEFFEPLYDLREEYFNTSRAGLLQEYLLMSRELIESAYYEYAVIVDSDPTAYAENQAEIAGNEIELEIFALFESVE